LSLFKNGRSFGKVSFDANTLRKERDKRNQVISYLTAAEAKVVGLDTIIKSIPLNTFPANSCNGFTNYSPRWWRTPVEPPFRNNRVESRWRRYVYGIPVYNKDQTEITMSVDKNNGNTATGLVGYSGEDKSVYNKQGKDGYFNKEKMPAYSHSFFIVWYIIE